ncbi:MAG: RDD family protein [Candidatus Omnitrophica bacterium ADurb.Bin292]|jgi:uncharacterized RDD family membrane protein YckC|nr:MAG: RDD family protein [Candidatus Omnitrophica bacterium ADurb.Bin292]HPW76342.1 RDD family protein [Candidatus Omnitrophota bacterium]HQB11437.1 RDD family protein [Candidatus Omnitrophota bacterium]
MDGLVPASKGKRFAAGLIDLVFIPIALGIIIGLVLLAAPDAVRNVVLICVNVGWLLFRDAVYSPGRAMVNIRIVSLTGGKVTWLQALIRNILLIIPFVLVVGYILEIVMLIAKGHRLADGWAKTQVLEA